MSEGSLGAGRFSDKRCPRSQTLKNKSGVVPEKSRVEDRVLEREGEPVIRENRSGREEGSFRGKSRPGEEGGIA